MGRYEEIAHHNLIRLLAAPMSDRVRCEGLPHPSTGLSDVMSIVFNLSQRGRGTLGD